MKNLLLILLLIVAFIMIVLGIKLSLLPPVLTGVGFILVAVLFYRNSN